VRSSFIALWVLGWVCLFYFISSLGNSFSKHNQPIEKSIALVNPAVEYLEVTATPRMKYYEQRWFSIEPFQVYNDDTVRVRNLKIRIVQSKTDSFDVKYVTMSNGKSISEANLLAEKINFSVMQQDSTLFLDRGIAITNRDKFRNQHVIMTIAVPVGKRFKITNKGWSQTNIRLNSNGIQSENHLGGDDLWVDEWNENWDNESYQYERGVEYKMTKTGLEELRRDRDFKTMEDSDGSSSYDKQEDMSDKEIQLQKLKEEREAIKNDIKKLKEEELQKEKTRVVKVNDLKKDDIGNSNLEKMNKIGKAAGKLSDLQWVLDRFTH
jgi:hypothetical protein